MNIVSVCSSSRTRDDNFAIELARIDRGHVLSVFPSGHLFGVSEMWRDDIVRVAVPGAISDFAFMVEDPRHASPTDNLPPRRVRVGDVEALRDGPLVDVASNIGRIPAFTFEAFVGLLVPHIEPVPTFVIRNRNRGVT